MQFIDLKSGLSIEHFGGSNRRWTVAGFRLAPREGADMSPDATCLGDENDARRCKLGPNRWQ